MARSADVARRIAAMLLAFVCGHGAAVATPVAATDDDGKTIALERPPARVVTLAPSLTELVFAAGAGPAVIAVDSSSDFPAEARSLPRIGDAGRVDVERVLALKPDLVVVWRHGNTNRELDQLERAGVRLFSLEPQRLDDVAGALERLGSLFGTEAIARPRAAALRERLASLRAAHRGAAPVRVFYQVWSSPLLTINRKQIVSEAIELCGGGNVFADLAPLVPQVDVEGVLAANPEAMFSADERGSKALLRRDPQAPAFIAWRSHRDLAATRGAWFYTLNGDAISRQGPRIVDGVGAICQALDQVRHERADARK